MTVSLFEEEAGTTLRTMSAVHVPAGPLPDSILLWNADELRDPPAAPCCLRSTYVGARAAVYRTGRGGAVAALVDFTADAEVRSGGGWAAEGVVHLLDSPLPRSVLLADDLLAPVFRHLRGRRGLPEPAASRLMALLTRRSPLVDKQRSSDDRASSSDY